MDFLKEISLQLYSDMHIEIWNKIPDIPVKAKYLFLAGDICQLNHPLFYNFFDYCSLNWEKVFYTPGNKEFYSVKKNYNELDFEYEFKLKERYKNVYYLNDNFVKLNEDIDVYGSIFWTEPTFTSTHKAKMAIDDYIYIKYFNKKLNHVVDLDINYVKELSETAYTNLKTHLENTNRKTIVVTHFPPIREGTTNVIYETKPETIKNYYSWNNETINNFKLEHVLIWISGHTHLSYNIYKNGCNFISNQYGYKYEIGRIGFDQEMLYEILY